jgi:hypothetical protein
MQLVLELSILFQDKAYVLLSIYIRGNMFVSTQDVPVPFTPMPR